MSQTLGKAVIKFGADDSPLQRSLAGLRTKMSGFQKQAEKVSQSMRKMFLVSSAAAGLGIRSYSDYTKNMAKVSTMLSGKGMEWMELYRGKIKRLSVQFGEGTDVLSDGLYNILSASVAPAQALQVLEVATKAAKGGFTDAAVAVSGTTSLLNSYGLAADQAAKISDLMFAAVRRGQFEYVDLANNIGKVAPMARIAGISMEQLFAMISAMTRQGLSMEETTTRLVAVFTGLAKAQDSSKKAAAELGIDLNTSAIQGDKLFDTLKKLQGLDLSKLMEIFPEVRAASGISILSGDVQGLKEDLDSMTNSAGAASEAFKKFNDTPYAKIQKLWAQIKVLAINIGEGLPSALDKVMPKLMAITKALSDFAEKHPRVTAGILGTTVALSGLAVIAPIATRGISGLLTVVGLGSKVTGLMVAGVGKLVWGLKNMGTVGFLAGGLISKSLYGVKAALTVLCAHPILAVITAVLAGLVFVFTKWHDETMLVLTLIAKGFFVFLRNVTDVFSFASSVALWFCKNFINFFIDMGTGLGAVFTNIGKNLWNFFGSIKDWMNGKGWNFQWTGLLEGFKSTVSEFPKYIKSSQWGVENTLDEMGQEYADKIAAKKLGKNWVPPGTKVTPKAEEAAKARAGELAPSLPGMSGTAGDKSGGGKASFIGLEEAWKKITTLGMGKSPEEARADKSVTLQQQQVDRLDKLIMVTQSGQRPTQANGLIRAVVGP
jgi:TP901 family phage tail tape measure protein